jgi:putative flippase GtrA
MPLQKELLKYMLAGGCSTSIDICCFLYCLHACHLSLTIALATGFIIGVFCNFIICNLFIFNRSRPFLSALTAHYSANASTLIVQRIGFTLLKNTFFIHHIILTRLLLQSITFLFNFFLIKHFAFNNSLPFSQGYIGNSEHN